MLKWFNILLGPVLAIVCYYAMQSGEADESIAYMAAVAAWMAVWWITEAVPLAVTSLLPICLYPVFGIMSTKAIAPSYMNDVLFLFVGGFIMAFAMEKWNLHKRIALKIILLIGSDINKILLGLMSASFILSMWISNTATTMMMIPTTLAVINKLEEFDKAKSKKLSVGLLLGIAYAASIGGTATLVGTPPNLIFLSHFAATFPDKTPISFLQWFMFGFPVALVFLFIAYQLLRKIYTSKLSNASNNIEIFKTEYRQLGKTGFEEKMVMLLFSIMALLWFSRADLEIGALHIPGWSNLFAHPEYFQDGTVAIAMAIILFLIPSKQKKGKMLMDWASVKKLPYNIILLFGGGFALAKGFTQSGLTEWLSGRLDFIGHLPTVLVVVAVCLFMTFITEITSNMATTQLVLPVFAAIAIGSGINPLLLMIPATFSASFAFMLPVATAPNTIIFGSEKITIKDMAYTGLFLNLIGVALISISMLIYGNWVFSVD